jgi:hypothetical protein
VDVYLYFSLRNDNVAKSVEKEESFIIKIRAITITKVVKTRYKFYSQGLLGSQVGLVFKFSYLFVYLPSFQLALK